MTLQEFILLHENDDTSALLLARHRFPDVDLDLAATTIECRRRMKKKVPSWYAEPGLVYPNRLCGEQCSSEETARLKARIARETVPFGSRIADLTGGLGVDAWAFSRVFPEVLYNEMQPALAAAARENFRVLGAGNIRVVNDCLSPDSLATILGDFRPDLLFLDPARRAEDGRKVFRLADCQPDVLTLLPTLFAACPDILLKLSPMADLTQLGRELSGLRTVSVVGADGECKELLLHLQRGYEGPYALRVLENGAALELEAADSGPSASASAIAPLLFEPGKALAKTGAFRQIAARFGLQPLSAHTHLYTAESIPEALRPFGKVFTVEEVLPLGRELFRSLRKRIPAAEITARNLPMDSDGLRRRLGIASGGSQHLFGVLTDCQGKVVLVTKPGACAAGR